MEGQELINHIFNMMHEFGKEHHGKLPVIIRVSPKTRLNILSLREAIPFISFNPTGYKLAGVPLHIDTTLSDWEIKLI